MLAMVMQAATMLRQEDARKDASWAWMRGLESAQPILLQRGAGAPTPSVQ